MLKVLEKKIFGPRGSFFHILSIAYRKTLKQIPMDTLYKKSKTSETPYREQTFLSNLLTQFTRGVKLLGFRISQTPKNGGGSSKFGPGLPTGNC